MHTVTDKDACLNAIEELNILYKSKSRELVNCSSLSKEMKIKEEMSKFEVQKKVLKRKLATLESEVGISA